mmetsp:Transcript_12968/g.19436  ORF Transcript_12968/g.19436 Transcript_12968/m.19436 type:complete len:572 (-) Transcript_12968:258-1973(-)|eukprot:CAMPEP_0116025084 /NCGR_PEP_ID=MMETSP0321-20121206/12784_1 /TAXON_ID=163516 /ORGANISM="Leptocylindrus danicus var. danicus, Strain B650" /LENGTH=571 /DNA_ID=CAMNT_0003497103 /DNA_START=305 /DNA_END=2020 /DNA_ORIENTATION=-
MNNNSSSVSSIGRFKKQKQETEAKKAYTNSLQEIQTLTQHLQDANLDIAAVAPNAIQICLRALKEERNKLERDERLRLKFSANGSKKVDEEIDDAVVLISSSSGKKNTELSASSELQGHPPSTTMQEYESSAAHKNKSIIMTTAEEDASWEDVSAVQKLHGEDEDDTAVTPLGKKLAEESISAMAQAQVTIQYRSSDYAPLAAIALALHGAMVSPTLAFTCTGNMPKKPTNTAGGFAAPIRDLPRGMFLPKDWDGNHTCIALRYRKDGVGNVGLKLALMDDTSREEGGEENNIDNNGQSMHIVQVQLIPMNGSGNNGSQKTNAEHKSLQFALDSYVNLVSLQAAAQRQSNGAAIMPALHFKNLAGLMNCFVENFDLGHVYDSHDEANANATAMDGTKQFVDKYMSNLPATTTTTKATATKADYLAGRPGAPPMIHDAFDLPRKNDLFQGNFSGDVVPAITGMPSTAPQQGNLMGPNHPKFIGGKNHNEDDTGTDYFGGSGGLPRFGGLGMQPRFDPYGPPGGPTIDDDPLRVNRGCGRGRGRGGRLPKPPKGGDPNPDHMKPPNDLSHMYM